MTNRAEWSPTGNVVPPTVHQTTVVTTDPVSIIVGDPDGEAWAWLMRVYVTDVAPTIRSVAAHLFMLNVFELRIPATNRTPFISDRDMGERMKMPKQSVSDARKLLLEHPQRPLARHGDGIYEPMPGRAWKQRRKSATPDDPGETVRLGGRLSGTADTPTPPHREARARTLRTEIENEDDNAVVVAARLLLDAGIGFTQPDAFRQAQTARNGGCDPVRQITNALAEARRLRDAKKLRLHGGKTEAQAMRGVIVAAVAQGWSLFDAQAHQERKADNAAKRRADDIAEVERRLTNMLSSDEAGALASVGGFAGVLDRLNLSPNWRTSLSGLALRERVTRALALTTTGGSSK